MSGKTEKKKRAEKKKNSEIKLTYRIFGNTTIQDNRPTNFFKMGLSKVNDSELPIPVAIRVDELVQEIESKGKTFERMRMKLLEKYKPEDDKSDISDEKEKELNEKKEKELDEKFEELLNQEFKITMEKIRLPDTVVIKPKWWREIKSLFERPDTD